MWRCCCYRKGTNFQANHNTSVSVFRRWRVVVATAKVQIFKQITTNYRMKCPPRLLLLLPQRYKFSSKSQPRRGRIYAHDVVVATAKVQIFKQITTHLHGILLPFQLLLLPQRYKFSSKSQRFSIADKFQSSCCCYRKGTNFQANHNTSCRGYADRRVVVATAKVQIFKQITTSHIYTCRLDGLLLLPQRYKFSSKSQQLLKGE